MVDKFYDIIIHIQRIFKVLNQFSRSGVAIQELIKRTGKRLIFPAEIRWLSILITFQRAVELSEDINAIASVREGWHTFKATDIIAMKKLIELLEPLQFALKMFEGDGLTISFVYGLVERLIKQYKASYIKVQSKFKFQGEEFIINSVRSRFGDVRDCDDPIYLAGASLDPRVAKDVLVKEKKEACKLAVKKIVIFTSCLSKKYLTGN